MSASENTPRRRTPRLIPRDSDSLATLRHRASLDYILDPRARGLEAWIDIWKERWPQVASSHWRAVASQESWDVARSDVWERYKGAALDVFVQSEIKRQMSEMSAQERLMDDMFEMLREGLVAPKSYEGMVSALVKLARLSSEQREGIIDRFGNPNTAAVAATASSTTKISDRSQIKRLARLMIKGGTRDRDE